MDVASQKFRFNMSPISIMGATAVTLLLAIAIISYNTAAESQGGVSKSTVRTNIESTQTTDASLIQATDSQDQVQDGASSSNISTTTIDATTSSLQGSVTVNGETYEVPPSGEFHQTVRSDDGQTSIDISSHTSGNGQNDSSSSNIRVYTQSSNNAQSSESESP